MSEYFVCMNLLIHNFKKFLYTNFLLIIMIVFLYFLFCDINSFFLFLFVFILKWIFMVNQYWTIRVWWCCWCQTLAIPNWRADISTIVLVNKSVWYKILFSTNLMFINHSLRSNTWVYVHSILSHVNSRVRSGELAIYLFIFYCSSD